jgi:hypothetical protein
MAYAQTVAAIAEICLLMTLIVPCGAYATHADHSYHRNIELKQRVILGQEFRSPHKNGFLGPWQPSTRFMAPYFHSLCRDSFRNRGSENSCFFRLRGGYDFYPDGNEKEDEDFGFCDAKDEEEEYGYSDEEKKQEKNQDYEEFYGDDERIEEDMEEWVHRQGGSIRIDAHEKEVGWLLLFACWYCVYLCLFVCGVTLCMQVCMRIMLFHKGVTFSFHMQAVERECVRACVCVCVCVCVRAYFCMYMHRPHAQAPD